jgi:TRAP-type mannitol/chloroaromatic compound transport system substrate-binding protein
MEPTLEEKLIQVLQTFDTRQTATLKELMQIGIMVEFLTQKVFERLTDEERAELEKEFQAFRDERYNEIRTEWQTLKEQAVKITD